MQTFQQKQESVADFRDRFGRANCVFVADYCGIDVGAVSGLRGSLRQVGEGNYEYHVVKNSILRRAAEGSDAEALVPHFNGPTAVAFSYADPVGLAKALVGFAEEHDVFELKAGLLDGRPIDTGEIATLATLPGLDELRGKIVGLLQAPAQKIAAVLQAPGAQLARVVEARRAQLEQGGA
jgi:large subunit ribosomal protein L10